MSTFIAINRVSAAFQQTVLWSTGQAPADWASGAASTAWAPVVTALNLALGEAGTTPNRRTVYAQLVGLLRQALANVRTTTGLSPAERQSALRYVGGLIEVYEPLITN